MVYKHGLGTLAEKAGIVAINSNNKNPLLNSALQAGTCLS